MLKSLALSLALVLSSAAYATSPQGDAIYKHIPNAKLVGEGTYSMAFWDIYKATLFAADGKYSADRPHALSITYFVEARGRDIASRSIKEMEENGINDQQKLSRWKMLMDEIFPDVENGTNLTAVATENGQTLFYEEGKLIGTVQDTEFTPAFFGIWLGSNTTDKNLRTKLLGG